MSSCSCLIQQKEVHPSVIQWKEGDRAQMIPTVDSTFTFFCDIHNIASCTEHTEASIIVFGYTQVSPPKRFQPVISCTFLLLLYGEAFFSVHYVFAFSPSKDSPHDEYQNIHIILATGHTHSTRLSFHYITRTTDLTEWQDWGHGYMLPVTMARIGQMRYIIVRADF